MDETIAVSAAHRLAGPTLQLYAAVAAGAAVALLYAPAPGEETRRRLAEKAREGRERADELGKQGREFVHRQRENFSTVVDKGREAVERGREAFDQARKETL